MFNRKLKERVEELEGLLEVEKFKRELEEDSKAAYISAFTTALTKDILTVDQFDQILDLQNKYFDILRNSKKGT